MKKESSPPVVDKQFKYLDVLAVLFAAVLIISNIASTKLVGVGSLIFDAGTILFPIAYILGDVLTEVYGFKKARRVIWLGFATLILMSLTLTAVQYMPAAPIWGGQAAFEQIAGFVPRIVAASLLAYVVGEFINAAILAKLKVKMAGKWFWFRSIVSSMVGNLFDTVIFTVVAFAGIVGNGELLTIIITVYLIKILFEIALLPITYRIVNFLKKHEDSDVYDARITLRG